MVTNHHRSWFIRKWHSVTSCDKARQGSVNTSATGSCCNDGISIDPSTWSVQLSRGPNWTAYAVVLANLRLLRHVVGRDWLVRSTIRMLTIRIQHASRMKRVNRSEQNRDENSVPMVVVPVLLRRRALPLVLLPP